MCACVRACVRACVYVCVHECFIMLATSPICLYFSGSHLIFIAFCLTDVVHEVDEDMHLLTYAHTYARTPNLRLISFPV